MESEGTDRGATFWVALAALEAPEIASKKSATGNGTLHMTGYPSAVEALVRAGTISRNAARVVTTVLDMMATSTNPAIVDVPLGLKDGSLAMGAIPLVRIPPITWP